MKIHEYVNSIEPEIYEIFKKIHENPELSMEEYETSELVKNEILSKTNIRNINCVGETGLIIRLEGKKSGPTKCIALRGDMDALPIEESKDFKLRSKNPGIMHACGHDIHTSVLLGTLRTLENYQDEIQGDVLFFFQQGEEVLGGAKLFLKSPYIDFSKLDGVAALHVSPEIDAGTIGLRYGGMLASQDSLEIVVKGKTGHAAHPHTVVDTVIIAAQIITDLQTLVSREVDPNEAAVLSICTINAGVKNNIIPEKLTMTGTLRTLSPEVRKHLLRRIPEVVEGIAESQRAKAIVNIDNGPPPLINDKEWAEKAFSVGKKMLGERNVIEMKAPSMGAEDFAFIMEKVPKGVFIRLGARTPSGPYGSMHSSTFYCDRDAIKTGILTLSGFVLDFFEIDF